MSNVKKYIAAISGGPDSMAMLHKYRKQIMTVCHVNYQKRDSANRDMMIVQDYCLKHKIKFCNLIVTKNIYEKYRKYGDNFQNIARLIRYDYFSKTAHKLKIQNLLVAHNKDDFIETSIMQLKRSTIALFLGIQQNSYYQDLNIYRPLITMWKKDILAYCKKNKIPYGLDETNELQLYERNKVRHLVSKWRPIDKKQYYDKVQRFNHKHHAVYLAIEKAYKSWKKHQFDILVYKKIPNTCKPYILYKYLREHDTFNVSLNKIKLIHQFLMANNPQTELRIGKNLYLFKSNNQLKIH